MKQCNTCKQWKDESEFHKDKTKKDGYSTSCILCRRHGKLRYTDLLQPTGKLKQCTRCKQWKDESEFNNDTSKKDGKATRCKMCIKYLRECPDPKTTDRNEQGYKYCTRCKIWQPVQNFHINNSAKDGLNSQCKSCVSDYDRRTIEHKREYIKTNIDRVRKYHKEYSEKHKKELREYMKQREQTKERKAWYKQYYKINKLNKRMGQNICQALKGAKAGQHWEDLVPYTLQQLQEHIESQFTPLMSWDNYGTYWEIDHIIPQNLFNIQSPEDPDFKICWSLANLRPLEKSLNRQRPKDGSDVPDEVKQNILNQKIS